MRYGEKRDYTVIQRRIIGGMSEAGSRANLLKTKPYSYALTDFLPFPEPRNAKRRHQVDYRAQSKTGRIMPEMKYTSFQ